MDSIKTYPMKKTMQQVLALQSFFTATKHMSLSLNKLDLAYKL